MTYIVIMFSLVLGVIGVYVGIRAFRAYTSLVQSVEPISLPYIVKLAARMGISGGFSFFALVTISGVLVDNNSDLTLQSILALAAFSIALGLFGFLGSLYQIYTTVKYRDFLLDKKIIKKK